MNSAFDQYVGSTFGRRYKIVKVIGIGGMAVVFKAFDLKEQRTVAVKMLKSEIANDAQAVRRLMNESKAVAMLSHPNIVKIYDSFFGEGLKYIVEEYVDGITLKNYIIKKGSLGLQEILNITEQILCALEHAHSKGIVHRDIKPQNIMILRNRMVKVTDFGIAKLPNAETVTMTDKAIGTVFYISPEQASGKPIDSRSDIYSLGVTMYEMATGKLPFVADSPVSVAIMQVRNNPKPPREINPKVPIGLEQIILGCMEKKPENRFQSAEQMLRHVAQVKNNPRTVFKVPKRAPSQDVVPESEKNPKRQNTKKQIPEKSSRSMFPMIAGVATAFFVVCCVSAVVVLSGLFRATATENVEQITIPTLVGSIYSSDLEAQLESVYYDVTVEYIYDSSDARNVIINQTPLPGEKRKINPEKQKCELKLTVCWGAETIELADYSYTDWRDARDELRNLGLVVETTRVPHEYIRTGYVISTEPEPGTTVKIGDTVNIIISSGQNFEYKSVPDFTNLDESAVMKMLNESGFRLGNVTYEHSETVAEGKVISQSKAVNSSQPVGTKIDFVMSLGPVYVETAGDTETTHDTETENPEDTDPETDDEWWLKHPV